MNVESFRGKFGGEGLVSALALAVRVGEFLVSAESPKRPVAQSSCLP